MLLKIIVLSLAIGAISCGRKEDISNLLTRNLVTYALQSSFFCPKGYEEKLKVAIQEVRQCTEDIYDESLLLCDIIQENLKNCTQPLLDAAVPCFKDNNKNLIAFIKDAILSVVEYVCEADGAHLVEFGNSCIVEQTEILQECMDKVSNKIDDTIKDKAIPTAKIVCQFTDMTKPCLKEHLEKACPDNVTRELYADLYEAAFGRPCTKYNK